MCSQNQAGVLSNTKGRRENAREEESNRTKKGERLKEGGVQPLSSSQDRDNWWRTSLVHAACSKNSWKWRREEEKERGTREGKGDRDSEKREKKGKKEGDEEKETEGWSLKQ